MIGKCHFQLEEYNKAGQIFEQFLQKYLKSELIPEAELWLAKTNIMQDQREEAEQNLLSLINKTDDEKLKSEAYYNLGEINFIQSDFESAIQNFTDCIQIGSDEIAGLAQFRLADTYYKIQNYELAAENYDKVLRYTLPVNKQYDAVTKMVDALSELGRYNDAEKILLNLLHDQRFKQQYSLIAVKLANLIEFQEDYEYAIARYQDVVKEYPRSEGAALANFYLGQIYEFEYGLFDSAKTKYDLVRRTNNRSEAAEDAEKRSKILAEYLKYSNQIKKDKNDIFKLEHGDSLLVDSLVTGIDTARYYQDIDTVQQKDVSDLFDPDSINRIRDDFAQLQRDTLAQTKKVKEKKVAVSRKPEAVRESLRKNTFQLAEYFLLTYEKYDSAEVLYKRFVENFQDSILIPKAYYSLYYIYSEINQDKQKADSIKNIIMDRYDDSIYGKKLSGKTEKKEIQSVYKDIYLEAEELMNRKQYEQAIDKFRYIAEQDSGSNWAIKSRFAEAYIYEKYMKDIDQAVSSYSVLAREYPASEQGRLAAAKIKEPEPEPEPEPLPADTTSAVQDTLLKN